MHSIYTEVMHLALTKEMIEVVRWKHVILPQNIAMQSFSFRNKFLS